MAELIINRIEEGLFTHTLTVDEETEMVIDSKPALTSFRKQDGSRFFNFKTDNGAPLIFKQRITPPEITITDSFGGTPAQTGFTSEIDVWLALGNLGYFQGFAGGSGGGGVSSFINLTDVTPNMYLGFGGMVYVVNDEETGLIPETFYNYHLLTQNDDVSALPITSNDVGKVLAVQMDGTSPKFMLTDLPQNGVTIPNGFTDLGEQTLVDGEYTATVGYEWNYSNIHYVLIDDYTITIDDESTGNSRIDVIHTLAGTNNFTKTVGEPSAGEGTALKPQIPVGSLELTQINIYEDNISEPTEPINGDAYLTKLSRRFNFVGETGDDVILPSPTEQNNYRLIGSGLTSISGILENPFSQPVIGDIFLITNVTGGSVTLNNSSNFITGGAVLPNGNVAIFTFEGSNIYRLVGSVGGGDFIPRGGTAPDAPITGDLEFEPRFLSDGNVNMHALNGDIGMSVTFDSEEDGVKLRSLNNSNSDYGLISAFDYGAAMIASSGNGGNGTSFTVIKKQGNFTSNSDSKGIVGNILFDKQNDPNAFAQMGDLEEIQPTLDEVTSTGDTSTRTVKSVFGNSSGNLSYDGFYTNGNVRALGDIYGRRVYCEILSGTLHLDGASPSFSKITGTANNFIRTYFKLVYESSVTPNFAGRELVDANFVNAGLALKANDADVVHKSISGWELGTGILSTDLNSIELSCIRRFTDITADRPFNFGTVQTFRFAPDECTQIAMSVVTGETATRKQQSGIWSSWVFLAITDNVVLKSGGNMTGLLGLPKYTTGTAPAYQQGATWFNTSLGKMIIGGATAWETVTSI